METINTMLSYIIDFDCSDGKKQNKLVHISFSNYENMSKPKGTYFQLHQHEYTQIIVLISGHGKIILNNVEYPIQGGELSILDTHFSHNDSFENHHRCFFLSIQNCTFFTQFNNFTIDISESVDSYYFYLYKIIEELSNKRFGYRSFVQSLFQCFLLQLSRDYTPRTKPEPANNLAPPLTVAIAREYILTHYSDNPSIEQIAQEVNISSHQLNILFKKYYNTTPHNFLLKAKIQASAYSLLTRDNTIQQIASYVGFATTQTYIVAFQRMLGMSPKKFRKTYAQDIKAGHKLIKFTEFPSERLKLPSYTNPKNQ